MLPGTRISKEDMMVRSWKIKGITSILVFLFALMLAPMTIHAGKKVPLLTIGLFDLTGPYSGLLSLSAKGFGDFVEWANKQPGYLPESVKWVHETYDTGMDIGKAVAAYHMSTSKKLVPIITTGGLASPTILALKPLAKRKRIPCIDGASARPIVYPPAWTFSMQGCYEGMIAASAQFLKDNWRPDTPYRLIRKRYDKSRNPRISVIGWDNAFGRGFDQKETRDYLKKIGVDWVQAEYVPLNPTDTTPHILRLVKAGVDMIYFGMYSESHAFILKDAARVGVRDKFQDMCFWADNVIQLRSYVGELANETMQLSGYQMDMSEWNPHTKALLEKSGLGENAALAYSGAFAWCDVYAECIRRAVKKVGPENVTGQVIYDMATNLTDYKCMAYNSRITFSKTRMTGPADASIYQLQDGKVVKIVDSIYVPDLLPGGKDVVK